MKTRYWIDFHKTDNLSPDELNSKRRNQRGVWLCSGASYEAPSARNAITQAKRDANPGLGVGQYRLRARRA